MSPREGRGAGLAQIRRHSFTYQQASAALRETRQHHMDALADVLTASQRGNLTHQSEATRRGGNR